MIRVAVVGGSGRMGQVIGRGLDAEADLAVVALVCRREPGAIGDAVWRSSVDELDPGALDVLVDFSTPEAAHHAITWAVDHDVAVVSGTTGFSPEGLERLGADVAAKGGHVIVAPNFMVSAVLAERFAAAAAPYFERVEVIELHHDRKVDAPSGTAISAARAIGAARAAAGRAPLADPTEREVLAGARGADGGDGVRVHSVRLTGLLAHQEILFGSPGEGLTIRHDAYDREGYVGGVALAVRAVRDRPGLTVGLGELL